jgi:CubicO group peptidase (beta-lactamase class C family)
MPVEHFFPTAGPGAAAAIAYNGAIAHLECVGLADVQAGEPVGPGTTFDLASVTKTFTAAAVLLLADRGRLDLNDPVGRHLSGFGPPAAGSRAVTVRDLLWHTSGLPDYLAACPPDELPDLTPGWVLDRARGWAAEARPGTRHEYSNTNYALLAEVVAAAAGCPYAAFLRAAVFDPLGLADTVVLGEAPRGQRARGYVNVGYGEPRFEPAGLDLPVVGDGGVFSSVRELVAWQEALYGGRLLGPAGLGAMFAPGRLDDGSEFDYGCGVTVERLSDGRTWCGHTGGWAGASALAGRYVEDGVSVVVLSNDQHAPVVRIAQALVASHLRASPGSTGNTGGSSPGLLRC